jgi:hypothetical protein
MSCQGPVAFGNCDGPIVVEVKENAAVRVIYYHLLTDAQIWLMTLYDKGEAADLSATEKRLLKAALDVELARRAARRRRRRK